MLQKIPALAGTASLALLGAGAAPAAAQVYDFVNIADSAGAFERFNDFSINDAGVVALQAHLDAGGYGIFAGSGGPLTTIADTTGVPEAVLFPSINGDGLVAFARLDADSQRLVAGSGGPTTTLASTAGPYAGFARPWINDDGVVAVRAMLDAGGQHIITIDGGTITVVASTEGPPYSVFGDPAINDAGTVAFRALLDGGAGEQIVTGGHGELVIVADTTGSFISFGAPAINDAGVVAFRAQRAGSFEGVFTVEDGVVSAIAERGALHGFSDPAINADGAVAFSAMVFEPRSHGIFIGDDPVTDAVIRSGDPLLGSAVTGLTFDRQGLSDNGDVAFGYLLSGGPRGVAAAINRACYADCDRSGALDFFDFLCFQDLFGAGDPAADCDGSGALDFFDFLCFQDAFAAGCP